MGFVPTGHRPIKSRHFYQAGIIAFVSKIAFGLFSVNCPLYKKFQIFNEYVQFLKKLYDIRRV
jgi:hypothetical protein